MINQERLSRYLEIERFRRPQATEDGLKLVVLRRIKNNPHYYEQYDKFVNKNLGNKKSHRFVLGESHDYHDPNSAPVLKFSEERAKKARLVSLPLNVRGAACENCSAYKPYQPNSSSGKCTHPSVDMSVHATDHCRFWNHPGASLARQDER